MSYLHGGHDESAVHYEQAERGGAHERAPAVHQQQPRQRAERARAHVARQRRRAPLRALDAHALLQLVH